MRETEHTHWLLHSSFLNKIQINLKLNSINLKVSDIVFKSSIVGKSAIVHFSNMPKDEHVVSFNKGFSYSGSFNNRELWWIKTATVHDFSSSEEDEKV